MDSEFDPQKTEFLADSVQRGASEAFAVLYERIAPAIYAWAALRAPSGVDPGDLLGEVWLHAVRNVARYEAERGSFRAWMFGIAKKVLLREMRDLARLRRSSGATQGDSLDLERVPESVTSLGRHLAREDSLRVFLERVAALGSEERELVVYCGLEGFTCAEAAVRLGLSEDAAAKRWQRLRTELRGGGWAERFFE